MKLIYFISATFKESLTTIIVGIAAFVLVLVLTLNFTAAMLSLVLVVSIAIFQKSFSRGWLFLFGIILLLPSTKIGNEFFNLHDVLLLILAVIGLVNIATGENKVKLNNFAYTFFLLALIGASYIVFGIAFDFSISQDLVALTVLLFLYWVSAVTFQFFFQTQKRLRRFFVLIIAIAVIHSSFGIVSFFFGIQTPRGLGISAGAIPYFTGQSMRYQVNGFLGDGYALRVGENALAPFLLVSIPLTLGLFVNLKRDKRDGLRKETSFFQPKKYHLLDSIYTPIQRRYLQQLAEKTKIQKALEWLEIVNRSSFAIFLLLLIQAVALALTFDYLAMLLLLFALFVFGILLRKNQIITISAVGIVLLTLVLPNVHGGMLFQSETNLSRWFDGFSRIKDSWVWGSGWKAIKSGGGMGMQGRIYNSYLHVWDVFGLFGLAVFLKLLVQFFVDLRRAYLESDGKSRIWLISILVIFFEMIILGISSNTLLFGPSALIFWLLYVAAMNLKKRKIVFGLTETHLPR